VKTVFGKTILEKLCFVAQVGQSLLNVQGFELKISTRYAEKHHMMYHVRGRAEFQGNPWDYTTFEDEGLTKVLKKTLRFCHQMAFQNMAFCQSPKRS